MDTTSRRQPSRYSNIQIGDELICHRWVDLESYDVMTDAQQYVVKLWPQVWCYTVELYSSTVVPIIVLFIEVPYVESTISELQQTQEHRLRCAGSITSVSDEAGVCCVL